jgi:hypothetical protein
MYYLIDFDRTELFEELLEQFRKAHPAVGNSLSQNFSPLINNIVSFIMNKNDVGA